MRIYDAVDDGDWRGVGRSAGCRTGCGCHGGGVLVTVAGSWWSLCGDFGDGDAGRGFVDGGLVGGERGDEGLQGEVVDRAGSRGWSRGQLFTTRMSEGPPRYLAEPSPPVHAGGGPRATVGTEDPGIAEVDVAGAVLAGEQAAR